MTDKEFFKKRYNFAIEGKFMADFPVSVVKVTGEDAAEFLQGQFTQNLSGLSDRESAYGFLLTQKGRVWGDAVLLRLDEEHWKIFSWSLSAGEMSDRLEAYIIADDVELADETTAWQAWRIGVGDQARDGIMADHPASIALRVAADLDLPWRVVVHPAHAPISWPEGWTAVEADRFEAVRIQAGWPRVPVDLGAGDFPPEGGRHRHGISYTKGCYLGQEVMARLAATGRLRRGLAWVSGSGKPPVGEVQLVQGDKTAGELRSRAPLADGQGWVGLAMMQLARFDETQAITTSGGRAVAFGGLLGG
jgi:hypothetical protein